MENNDSIQMTLSEMESRLSEWIFDLAVVVSLEDEDTNEKVYSILDNYNQSIIFEHRFSGQETTNEDLEIVSTSEIKDEELRCLIEDCYKLDMQIAEAQALKNDKTEKPLAKGEWPMG